MQGRGHHTDGMSAQKLDRLDGESNDFGVKFQNRHLYSVRRGECCEVDFKSRKMLSELLHHLRY